MQLYQSLGFTENPFSRFSAEEEMSYLKEIFYEPKYYSTIFQDILRNNSRYIFGERGSGKSALMFRLIENLRDSDESLIILIDNYSEFVKKSNNLSVKYIAHFIRKIIQYLVRDLLVKGKNPSDLSQIEKEKLSFIITNFFSTISRKEFEKFQDSIGKKVYNNVVNPIVNNILSGAVTVTSDFVSRSFGLPVEGGAKFYREYIPSLKENTTRINILELSECALLEILEDLLKIIVNLDYKTITIFMDKIDEQQELASDIDKEVRILLPLLRNNQLILNKKFSFVFILWSKVKKELNSKGVRFDKIKPFDINWSENDLINIMKKRVLYFSEGKSSLDSLFQDKDHINLLANLSNKSPRDFLHLMSNIYDQQSEINSNSGIFSIQAVEKGIISFLKTYDFYSIYPAQKGTKQDIRGIISKLKKIGKIEFKIKDVMVVLKLAHQASSSHIKIMKNYGIVKEKEDTTGKEKEYIIRDPKIVYIITHNLLLE